MTQQNETTNRLINETSPYLLQHAYNPVDWYPWGNEALEKAKLEDKPIIVSIGYSACHWCHVMERESFENQEIAAIMNKDYICIKVDREERPDIDQIYMDAVQAMGINGGWPLNVILTPTAKPFYGGTYFTPNNWGNLLENITQAFVDHRGELEKSADGFTYTVSRSEVEKYGLHPSTQSHSIDQLQEAFNRLSKSFDLRKGGMNKAPKFPMPSIYQFLLRLHHLNKSPEAIKHVELTLDQMAYGGIYDQIGGGFARYSTDSNWFCPHFEKMLYDNGQLLTLYSEAFATTQKELYKEIVYQTIDFAERELLSQEGGFYSALDADSEGEEGKFYCFSEKELREILGEHHEFASNYYNTEAQGNWEDDKNILFRALSDQEYAKANNSTIERIKTLRTEVNIKLLAAREDRIKPGLDDKILTSWNGLMLCGLVKAYRTFGQDRFLQLALCNARFIKSKIRKGNQLYRTYKNERATQLGFLEDYATVIDGFTQLYEATFEDSWLYEAEILSDYVINQFFDPKEGLFFFTDKNAEKLIAKKKEIFDNVIPASNSMMANSLFRLGSILERNDFLKISTDMLNRLSKAVLTDLQYLSNWGIRMTYAYATQIEIAIVGPNAKEIRQELDKHYFPNSITCGTLNSSKLPLLRNRFPKDGETLIYICMNKSCKLPVQTVDEALELIKGMNKQKELV
jgi:uncharacterized protein